MELYQMAYNEMFCSFQQLILETITVWQLQENIVKKVLEFLGKWYCYYCTLYNHDGKLYWNNLFEKPSHERVKRTKI